jgi:pyruvate dehydrogenase E2 component (dihydrolipoamide acetyltransferase)
MPRQGQSVESCIITKWHKKEGDAVKTGDLLFSYETDKAAFDEESKYDGILLKILHFEDEDVPCLENVCIIGEKGEDISQFLTGKESGDKEAEQPAAAQTEKQAEQVGQPVQPAAAPQTDGRVKISPRAKNIAEKLGIDYTKITGSGPEGRIIEKDIDDYAAGGVIALRQAEAAQEAQPAQTESAEPYYEEKLSNIRKTIAKAMHNSLQTTAQLTHTASFDATQILAFRAAIKPLAEKGEISNITLNDIIMYATVKTLKRYRVFNAHMLGDKMRFFNNVNIAMAVDTERGLMVPVCFGADKLTLSDLSKRLKTLSDDCKKGSISPDLLSGGGFTVSNLGSLGIETFTPILNAPQTGILGVGTVVTRVRQGANGIETYPAITLSFTYDHRAADGVEASKFLRDLCVYLENFTAQLALEAAK